MLQFVLLMPHPWYPIWKMLSDTRCHTTHCCLWLVIRYLQDLKKIRSRFSMPWRYSKMLSETKRRTYDMYDMTDSVIIFIDWRVFYRTNATRGLFSWTTSNCFSATSLHTTHSLYIVNYYHPTIFSMRRFVHFMQCQNIFLTKSIEIM